MAGNRASEGNPRAGRADARIPRSTPWSAVPVRAFLGTEGTGSFIASRLCGAKGERRGQVVRGGVENRLAETERATTLRSILRVWRRSDTETRACARRDGSECGVPRRSSSGIVPRRIWLRDARCREGTNDTPRVGGDRRYARTSGKNNSAAINFLPSLNGATDERAPRRWRPSRLGRARRCDAARSATRSGTP